MKKLILFDIDGTVLKLKSFYSRKIFSEILTEVFGVGISYEKMPNFAGMTDLQIINEIALEYNIPQDAIHNSTESIWHSLHNVFSEYCNKENLILMPGIEDLIKTLQENNENVLGLLTGNFKENAYLKLKVFGLDKYFAFGAFGNDIANRNLLPELAVQRANLLTKDAKFSAANTIIIGDSPRDIECAKFSGSKSVAVATGGFNYDSLKALNPDLVFHNFSNYKETAVQIINLLETT